MRHFTAVFRWLLPLVLLWLLLSLGQRDSWGIGLPSVLLAAWAAWWLRGPTTRWRPAAMLRFAAYFLRQSLAGGIDVARRALTPRMPLDPGFLHIPLHLPPGPAQTFFIAVVSLLPGTLSAAVDGDRLQIHVLDQGQPVAEGLAGLQTLIAEMMQTATPAEGVATP